MANTVITLKKSATPSQVPGDLANGELAINYADGKLFYKDSTGSIQEISGAGGGGNTFSTINAAGTFVVAGIPNDILELDQGNNIIITGDSLNNKIAIAANLVPAFDYANTISVSGGDPGPAFNKANDAYSLAQTAFDRANTSNDVLFIVGAYDTANAAYDKANAANILACTSFDKANSALQKISNDSLTFTQTIPLVGPNLSNTAGERIIFWDQRPGGPYYNYSFGLEQDAIWFGVDTGLATTGFNWYTGNTKIMELARNANLTISYVNANNIKFGDGVIQTTGYNTIVFDTANAAFDKANAANLLAYGTGIGANAYAASVGVVANAYTDTVVVANLEIANAYSRVFANSVGDAVNTNTSVATISANAYATSVGASGNAYADSVGLSGNNFSGVMANSVNAIAITMDTAGNNYTNAVGIAANTWANTKLANTDGVVFNGSLHIANTLYAYDLVLANSMIANISGDVYNMNVRHDLYIGNNITNISSIIFNSSTNRTPTSPGELTWSTDDSTLHFDTDSPGNVILHIGQDLVYYVKNQSGQTIYKGNVCMFAGTLGASGRITVKRAIANNAYPSKYVIGVAAADMLNGNDGFVVSQGRVRGIDTSMFSQGDILYLSPTNPGQMQNTMPSAPNNKVTIAAVIHNDNTVGSIQVRPTYGSKINEDELAEINGITDGDVLIYNGTPGRFENKVQLALNAGSVDGLTANTIIEAANGYSRVFANTVGTAGNANLSVATVAANSYATSVGASSNNFAGSMANSSNAYASATYYTKAGGTISGDVIITGNLTISGNTTYANTQTLLIGDNILTLNADIPNNVAPSENAGLEVNRGNKNSNAAITWNETAALWMFTNNNQTNLTTAIASNTSVDSAGGGANAYTDTVVVANLAIANAYSRVFANSVGTAGNANLSVATVAANTYAASVGVAANAYTDTVVVANLAIANAYTRTFANTKLANTSGVTFAGDLYFPSGNVGIGTTSPGYKLDVNGTFHTTGSGSFNVIEGNTTRFYNTPGVSGSTAGEIVAPQVYQATGGSDAAMTFHVAGDYAVHFGLDGSTNDLFVGGWSMGAVKYKVWHAGNDGAGSGLDADTLDGQSSAYFAPAASPTFTGTVNMNANNAFQTLTDAATIAWDVSLGQVATVTLGAAGRTMGAPTNLKVGTYILHVLQDGSGGRTITTWNGVFKWPGGVAPTLTTTASARDVFSFVCDGTNMYGSFLPDVK